jgi:hypothetical protein
MISILLTISLPIRSQILLEDCISVSNWFDYTFFEYPKLEKGFCIVNHSGKTVQISDYCNEELPSIECFDNLEKT